MIIPEIRRWLSLVAVFVVLILALLFLAYCHEKRQAQEARDQAAISEGRTQSAVEAISEIGKLGERGEATQTQVKEAQDAIRNAAPDDRDAIARAYLKCLHDPSCNGL